MDQFTRDICEALDIDPNEVEQSSENQQDPATPAEPDTPAAGANEQEATDPAEATENTDPQGSQDDGQSTGGQEDRQDPAGGKPEQTPEERRQHAAQRRAAEQQAAIDEAIRKNDEKHQAEMNAFFEKAALKNTITGEPIRTMEDFESWNTSFATAKAKRDLKDGRLTAESLNQLLEQNPVIQAAKQMLDSKTQQAADTRKADFDRQVAAEIAEIHQMDPSINSVEDLKTLPEYEDFYGRVEKGYSYLDAYKLSTEARRTQTTNQQAQAAAIRNAAGKSHLHAAGAGRGPGTSPVPSDQLVLFRQFNPDATEAEIQEFYNKNS